MFFDSYWVGIVHQSQCDVHPNRYKKKPMERDLPSLCNDDVVKWLVLVAEARQTDSDDHFVCFESLTFVTSK
jgi:hypothetical protein